MGRRRVREATNREKCLASRRKSRRQATRRQLRSKILSEIQNQIPQTIHTVDIENMQPDTTDAELFEDRIHPHTNIIATAQFEPEPGCSHQQSGNDDTDEDMEDNTTSFVLSGRRIVDIGFLFEQLLGGEKHKLFDCGISDMKVVGEVRKGFMSTFTLKCKMCDITQQIYSEDPRNRSGTTESMDINSALTLGAISTGIGYSALAEISGALNMPMMAENTFSQYHDKLSNHICATAKTVMEEAGKEEAELATNLGDVDENGVPFITVIADGAWSKRSYNVNYNAASGVGCIVGHRTGKLLYLGVRNKFCSTCDFYSRKGLEIPEHKCSKNWVGTSTSMETDIIVEGFRNSIATHGLKYLTLVGDGDSSVYSKLMETKPYGPQTVITKIECRNHLLRNFSSKLRDISKRRRSASSNDVVPMYLRKEIENNSKRLRFAISKATKYRINENTDFITKVKTLKEDILNAPSHVFGEHAKCEQLSYFNCKRKGTNFVLAMKECGVYRDIEVCMNRLILHIDSLLYNMNNNVAEHYNSIVCKFVGGKRVNYSKRRSYQTRCEAAAIAFNKGPDYYEVLHKSITNHGPSRYTNKYMEKILKRKKRYVQLSNERKMRRQQLRLQKGYAVADKDYGNVSETIPDMDEDEYASKEVEFLYKLKKTKQEIEDLQQKTKNQSFSKEWMEERQKRITASNFGKICKMKSTTRSTNTIKELLYKKFKGNKATEYGKLNEPFAIKDFEKLKKVRVAKCGFFIDTVYPFLGASPDGLVGDRAIVEVKCPFNAKDTSPEDAIGLKKVTFGKLENGTFVLNRRHNYYFQVQGQLAVTEREKCFFVVWSPKGCLVEEILRDEQFWRNEMLPKLKIFYFNCLLPELIDPRLTRGLEIRENSRKRLRAIENYDGA